MKIIKYQIKIKGIKEPIILDDSRGRIFKERYDSRKPEEKGNLCRIGDQWSGTWHDISHVFRFEEYVPSKDIRSNLNEKDRGPIMTFQEFKAKYPEKARLLEKNF